MSYTATQEEISAAWSAWKSRHGEKLGPGPAFVEAINAALSIRQRRAEAALSTDAEPVKTPFEVASKHIPEARVSLLSRAIRQGLNDYGWKNLGTLPEVLMGYIVEAERAEAAVHAEPVKTAPAVAVKALEWRDEPIPPSGETLASSVVGLYCIPHSGDRFYLRFRDATTLGDYSTLDKAKAAAQADYEARILSALSAQVQEVVEYERREQVCKDAALSQWERSLKRPDLDEKARVVGAIEAYKRQAFAFTMVDASPASKHGDAE